jgi:putative endonuclease
MAKTAKQQTGKRGEDNASLFLIKAGYKIIARNYLIKGGEIDIIAWHKKPHHGKTLCFVEVKTRKEDDGSAERATDKKKLQSLFRTAKKYCIENDIDTNTTPIQFEQVSVYEDSKKISHYIIPVD